METNEIMVNDVNENLDVAYEANQEVETEGGIGNAVGGVALLGLALYGGFALGKKAIAGGKKLLAKGKDKLAERKTQKESNVEPDVASEETAK
jgi:hypothetical protein